MKRWKEKGERGGKRMRLGLLLSFSYFFLSSFYSSHTPRLLSFPYSFSLPPILLIFVVSSLSPILSLFLLFFSSPSLSLLLSLTLLSSFYPSYLRLLFFSDLCLLLLFSYPSHLRLLPSSSYFSYLRLLLSLSSPRPKARAEGRHEERKGRE